MMTTPCGCYTVTDTSQAGGRGIRFCRLHRAAAGMRALLAELVADQAITIDSGEYESRIADLLATITGSR